MTKPVQSAKESRLEYGGYEGAMRADFVKNSELISKEALDML